MIQNSNGFREKLETVSNNSPFLTHIGKLKKLQPRGLIQREIEILENQGNVCGCWSSFRVTDDFKPDNIRNNYFAGTCILTGDIELYGNFLRDVLIEESAVVLFSSLNGPGGQKSRFGIGTVCAPGLETGGRTLPIYPDLDYEAARFFCERFDRSDADTIAEDYRDFVRKYTELAGTLPYSVVSEGAVIHRLGKGENFYFGKNVCIENGQEITNSFIGGTLEETKSDQKGECDGSSVGPCVGSGGIVRNTTLQAGSSVDSGGIVENAVLLKHSRVYRYGKVFDSCIGPETEIAEGEVTASFVGPFTGFHHQALLISSYWPDGKGNIGSGANVGSNHTSRLPDQELRPGEGMFFGLGCNVKFPADYSDAPYSIIATGVTTLPQKVGFPFSLIVEGDIDSKRSGINRILPGWVLYGSMYTSLRGEYKYKKRAKLDWDPDFLPVFRGPVIEKVYRALSILRKLDISGDEDRVLGSEKCPELGKNYTTEKEVRRGVEAYSLLCRYYLLYRLEIEKEQFIELNDIDMADDLLGDWKKGEKNRTNLTKTAQKICILAKASLEKDFQRGVGMFSDYDRTHPLPENDPVLENFRKVNGFS